MRAFLSVLWLLLLAAMILPSPRLCALDEPLPAYEKGLYDWTGNDWGLQHHIQAGTSYDDNPLRESYSSHPLPDFAARLNYGFELGRYLDRYHYARIDYDAQASAWGRYTQLNTVDHTLDARLNYFDPQIDVTGFGWFFRPRVHVQVRKAPEDFIANAAPRRVDSAAVLPIGYRLDTARLETGVLWRQTRYLESGFDVLDSRDIGGFAEWETALRPERSAMYARLEYRSIDRRFSSAFDDFTVSALRVGWRQQLDAVLRTDIGIDAALFSRQSNQAPDNTPASAVNFSPYIDVAWQADPQSTQVAFSLKRRFEPDTAVSASALTTVDLHVIQVVSKDLLELGLLSRASVAGRLGGGSATFFTFKVDANLHYAKADWPPLTIVIGLGLDLNRSDLPGSSYQARVASISARAVF